jgi:methylenetetrahydrofolate reductase (NADPH)
MPERHAFAPSLLDTLRDGFAVTVEVVPPASPDPQPLIEGLKPLTRLGFFGFSVASNPVAHARMSALAFGSLLQAATGRPVVLHCTTRDHNSLSLQGLLWGAAAHGIRTVLAATGDLVALDERLRVSTVRDMDVFGLIRLARDEGLETGVVVDVRHGGNGPSFDAERLRRKAAAGAQFAVSQPLFDRAGAETLASISTSLGIPILLGILPPRTARHVQFLSRKVAGIEVPEAVQRRMVEASDPEAEGLRIASEMLDTARELFAGACLMPPFNRFEVLRTVLAPAGQEGT